MQTFKIGDSVVFGRKAGEKTRGTVVKVNTATVKVRQDEARGTLRDYAVGTIWTVPHRLCSVMGGQPTTPEITAKRPTHDILRDIRNAYCALSPENLHCDGEATHGQAMRMARKLNAYLKSLFRELGHTVSEDEAFRA